MNWRMSLKGSSAIQSSMNKSSNLPEYTSFEINILFVFFSAAAVNIVIVPVVAMVHGTPHRHSIQKPHCPAVFYSWLVWNVIFKVTTTQFYVFNSTDAKDTSLYLPSTNDWCSDEKQREIRLICIVPSESHIRVS